MKQTHQSLRDDSPLNTNDLLKTTGLANERTKSSIKREIPQLPKRKLAGDKHQLFYCIHLSLLPVMLFFGFKYEVAQLIFFVIPYAGLLVTLYRIGGGLSLKEMNYVVWNLSVLVSTLTNAKIPRLRKYGNELRWGGGGLLLLGSLFSPWFMALGGTLFMLGMLFSFAEKDAETMAEMAKIVTWGLLVTGVLSLFVSPGMTLVTLTTSLLIQLVLETWEDYEFTLE